MRSGRIVFNLLAKVLEMILYNTLQRLIGLFLETFITFFSLGINAINVWFTSSSKRPEKKKFKVACLITYGGPMFMIESY
jgi:hypothetical protein